MRYIQVENCMKCPLTEAKSASEGYDVVCNLTRKPITDFTKVQDDCPLDKFLGVQSGEVPMCAKCGSTSMVSNRN